jgi:hypothetical protein
VHLTSPATCVSVQPPTVLQLTPAGTSSLILTLLVGETPQFLNSSVPVLVALSYVFAPEAGGEARPALDARTLGRTWMLPTVTLPHWSAGKFWTGVFQVTYWGTAVIVTPGAGVGVTAVDVADSGGAGLAAVYGPCPVGGGLGARGKY